MIVKDNTNINSQEKHQFSQSLKRQIFCFKRMEDEAQRTECAFCEKNVPITVRIRLLNFIHDRAHI